MVSSLTQSKLVNLLQTIAKGEQDRESSRLSLTKNYSFESYVAFKRLDRYSDNSLSIGEVINFLKDNRIQVHEKELRPFFEVYSCKGGVRLTYTDFQKIVLPKTNGLLKHQCLGRKVQALAGDELLDLEIEKALSSLIHSEVVFLQKVESLKEELATRHDFGLLDAFKLVDEENRGSLDFTSVYNFLEKNGRVTKTDVEALFTRFDKNRDQELSYSEFVQLLQPINPNYRVSLRSPSPVRKSTSRAASPRVSSPKRKEANPYVAEFVSTPVKSKRQTEEDNYKDYLRETAAKSTQSPYSRATPVRSPKVTNTFEEAVSPSRTVRSTYSAYQSPVSERKQHTYGDGFLSLGNIEKRELARFLKDQLDLDRNLEKSKKELVGQRRFDSAQLFKVFDPESKGYITRGQLEAGLKEFNIFPSKNELYLLMRVLDKNGDGLVRYREFKEEIEPRDHKSVFSSDKQDDISYEVRRLLRRLLNQIISNELRCEELRRHLNKRMQFSVFEAFTNLKKSYTEFVTAVTFKDLLNEQGIFASIEDCELLVIRYDRNKNGRVSYSEFVNEMVQKVPLNEDNANEEKPKENKSVVVEKANQEQAVIVEEPKEEEAGEEKSKEEQQKEEQPKEEKPDQEQANEEKSKEEEK